MGERSGFSLFETVEVRSKSYRVVYKVFAYTVLVGISGILGYRLKHMPRSEDGGRLAWFGMFVAELWFSVYWVITQSVRWYNTTHHTFKDTLSLRYGDDKLPPVDIFVFTANPIMEPPSLVVNTVLSVLSYNYPPEKLSVYLSDDGGSVLTFYALLEASQFSKHWIPFCKKFAIEPRSPATYFAMNNEPPHDTKHAHQWLEVKKLYEEMKMRVDLAVELGSISEEIRNQHKGFLEWTPKVTMQDHQSIVQILVDGRDASAVDIEGQRLPTLVYVSREKRPKRPHNFKAGAINALIRVSLEISNGPVILSLDCDMYSNNSDSIRDALCFFMDEERGDQISYVQYPQNYNNITKNDVYANHYSVIDFIELTGIDGYGGALYCGTGCFLRRESLCGGHYSKDRKIDWKSNLSTNTGDKSISHLEEASKLLINCNYEDGTLWGKEMGLVYGCAVEDIITGLTIQCRGWKPVYFNPDTKAFFGVAPTTLEIALVQFKRWSEGMFQIFISKYCPLYYGHGKIKLGAQLGYCVYLLWAPNSVSTLYYVIVPSLCLLRGVPLFPEVSSPWFLPFAYVFVAKSVYSVYESLMHGSTLKAWWNLQFMWLVRRTTSYSFAFVDTIIKQLGFTQTKFVLTPKIVDDDVLKRYENEIMEFGSSSPMVIIIATLAMLNLFALIGGVVKYVVGSAEGLIPHIILCGLIVTVNFPVYEALFVRSDKGRFPTMVMFVSIVLASLACLLPIY